MADYHSLLMRAVANLPNSGTPATRGAIYERARKALLDQLRSLRPPLPESESSQRDQIDQQPKNNPEWHIHRFMMPHRLDLGTSAVAIELMRSTAPRNPLFRGFI